MFFWSKGLGRSGYLIMELGTEEIAIEDGNVLLKGRVRKPVNWNYTITLDGSDWDDFFRVAFAPETARYLARRERFGDVVQLTRFLARFVVGYLAALIRPKPEQSTARNVDSIR